MKILVVSDTHSNTEELIVKLKGMKDIAMLFYLGDYVEDGEKIAKELKVPSVIVMGNGDYGGKYKEDELIDIQGKKIFLTHGHKYGVRFDVSKLYYKGKELKADLVLFGHTHVPVVVEEDNIIIMNPGSPSYPRGYGGKKTIGVIKIGENIETEIIELKNI